MKQPLSFFLVFLFSFSSLYGQLNEINWGELHRKKGTVKYLMPADSNEFYALRWTGGTIFGHYQLTHNIGLVTKESINLKSVVDKRIATFEGVRVINGKPMVFLSDKFDDQHHFYMQPYTKDLEPDGDPIILAAYQLERKRKTGFFDVRLSSNGKFFAVVWNAEGKKETKDLYGFKVFDTELNLVQEGEYPVPFDPELSEIKEHYISNTGDYFLCVTEYIYGIHNSFFKKDLEYKALHIFHINEELGLEDYQLNLDGKRVVAMALTVDSNDVFSVTGVYGERGSPGVNGIFYRQANLSTAEVLKEGFEKFDEDFIKQDWPESAQRRINRRQRKQVEEPYLHNYRMRDAIFLDDGSIVGTMEQFYVYVRNSPDMRSGSSSSVYYYYYNDIVIYKINPEGTFDWIEKVHKYQVSVNDGGPYSGYESVLSNGKAYFIFNDDVRNYDSTGVYIDREEIFAANFGRKKNALAITEVDLMSGKQKRSVLFRREETKTLGVPKLFKVNYDSGEIIIYTISRNKEKVGTMTFNPN